MARRQFIPIIGGVNPTLARSYSVRDLPRPSPALRAKYIPPDSRAAFELAQDHQAKRAWRFAVPLWRRLWLKMRPPAEPPSITPALSSANFADEDGVPFFNGGGGI